MTLTAEMKQLIRDRAYLLDEGNNKAFFEFVIVEFPTERELKVVVDFLDECGVDTVTPRCEILAEKLIENLEWYKKQPVMEDPSNGWSRLQWQLVAIGQFCLKYAQIVEYLDAHKAELGIKMIPLELPYGWEGSDDYNLGWFDCDKFDQMYSKEEWY